MPPNILLFYCSNLWALTTSALKFLPGLLLTPQIAKGGYLYTPQIKFGRILNNSRFCRLYGVFLRRRYSAFLQIAPISRRAASARCLFSANGPDWPANAPPAIKNYPTRLCRFLPGQQIAPVFCAMYFFSTNQPSCKIAPIFTFFICLQKTALFCVPQFQGRFWLFYFRTNFSKTGVFLRVPKISLHFNHTKRGGIFHFKPPKQHLKLKFIFLKSTQNLWKGFWENLTMCHILPHFAGKQCAFFN